MVAMQRQIVAHVHEGLMAALGVSAGAGEATRPSNSEAYELILRAAAMSSDSEPNRQALKLLQKAVTLDPGFAAGWEALANRYYNEGSYSSGGDAAYTDSQRALEKARSLDPNNVRVLRKLIVILPEKGRVAEAYDAARDLLQRRPDDAEAHFGMAYVLRYAGLTQESARECDAALARDPTNVGFRSCTLSYMMAGDYERARQVERLEPGSEWMASTDFIISLRRNDLAEARAAVRRVDAVDAKRAQYFEDCLDHKLSSAELHWTESWAMSNRDSEKRYLEGATLAYCNQPDRALHMLSSAVNQNYCATFTLQHDPLLAPLRLRPEFAAIVQQARLCQQAFFKNTGTS
jgi:tetratricopeptide (TPR) repeat protein